MPPLKDRIPEDLREIPAALWDKIRADPVRAPEHIALFAADFHGPAAAKWVQEKRSFYAVSSAELAAMARRNHVNLASFEGAALGVGGFITVLPDLAALAWIQSRMVFFIAAAYGYDPRDPLRPAELLVLQELYPDVPSARAALDGSGQHLAGAMVRNSLRSEHALLVRLTRMVGKRAGKRMLGRVVPFAASAFNAVGNRRDAAALADKAMAFYGSAPVLTQPVGELPPPAPPSLEKPAGAPSLRKDA